MEQTQEQEEAERRLNAAFAAVFCTPSGELVRQYLRRNFIELIKGPESSDASLRYHEGGRAVVATIETRIAAGRMNSDRRPGDPARRNAARRNPARSRKPSGGDS